jgi:hypothetical protein
MSYMKIDPIVERACTWSLNTIIWSYHSAVIIQTNIKEEGRNYFLVRMNNFKYNSVAVYFDLKVLLVLFFFYHLSFQ